MAPTLCGHPGCTGRHSNTTPVALHCPAARARKRERDRLRDHPRAGWRDSLTPDMRALDNLRNRRRRRLAYGRTGVLDPVLAALFLGGN